MSAGGTSSSVDTSVINKLTEKAPTKMHPDNKAPQTAGELEMVLAGLDLSYMIPLFQEHQVTSLINHVYNFML